MLYTITVSLSLRNNVS
jgi:tetratricopeptide (TPR) repeat protein